ncbi:MAG: 50S ribosomal protein L22 [Bacteroidota bacterium]
MGSRKRLKAEERKEDLKGTFFAKLNNCPTSPRKMRLVVELIRGKKVDKALHILKACPKDASNDLHKLLLSAIANWQHKNEGVRMEDSKLYIKEVMVDSGRMMKRLRPAPQGRAYRVRKRSNHVTLLLESANINETQE